MLLNNPMFFANNSPPPVAAATLLSRSSVFLLGADQTQYYTIPQVAYPNGDWAEILLVKFQRAASITQHLFGVGNFGGGSSPGNVSFYINGTFLRARIINASGTADLTTSSTAIVPSLIKNGGWYVCVIRRVGANIELVQCPLNGTATTVQSSAVTGLGAMTPNTAGGSVGTNIAIGIRTDLGAGTQLVKNNISYYARMNGTLTNAQIQNLAAGQDIVADLGITPLINVNFTSLASTITDLYGNIATKHGTPALRGGPSFAGQPVTISQTPGGFYEWFGRGFNRSPSSTSGKILTKGTYNGSPGSILVRVIDKLGNQVTAPKAATYPSAGNWVANISVPQGVEYTIEAYHGNDITKVARSQLPWGVGIVLPTIGESLSDQQAQGNFTEAGLAPVFEQVSIYDQPDAWMPSTVYSTGNVRTDTDAGQYGIWQLNPAGNGQTSGSGTFAADRAANPTYWTQLDAGTQVTDSINSTNGYIMHTIARVNSATGLPVMAAIAAKTGSQSVNTPNNWGTYSDPVTHGKVRAMAALIGDGEAALWNQGANDANVSGNPCTAATFAATLQGIIPQLRTYFPLRNASTLPFFVSIVGSNALNNSTFDSAWRAVRNGGITAIAAIANAFHSGGLFDLTHSGNGLHPDGTAGGYFRMCKRQAQGVLNYLLPGTYPTGCKGESVLSATISGANTIDIVFTLNAGTTLQGLINNTAITGFTVTNAALSAQTISSTSIPSANTVRLTMATTPVSGWIVDYIPTEFPDPSNLLYTNASVIGDTAGIPVLPFTAPITL